MKNDDTIILRIMDQTKRTNCYVSLKNTDAFTQKSWECLFLIKDRPDILKPHPQMTAMINRRYSES